MMSRIAIALSLGLIVAAAPVPGRADRWHLLIRLLTGRFHQIRIMCAALGLPLAGDPLYGGVRRHIPGDLRAVAHLERPFLHAARLAFKHPADHRRMEFTSPLPGDLQQVLDSLSTRK